MARKPLRAKGSYELTGLTNRQAQARIKAVPPDERGPVAQLGARFHGMEEVVGSIPTRSTIFKHLEAEQLQRGNIWEQMLHTLQEARII